MGGVLGCVQGAIEGSQLGLTMRTGFLPHVLRRRGLTMRSGYLSHVLHTGAINAVALGAFIGLYFGLQRYMVNTRQRTDFLNPFVAGAGLGAICSYRTRSPIVIAIKVFTYGGVYEIFDSIFPNEVYFPNEVEIYCKGKFSCFKAVS